MESKEYQDASDKFDVDMDYIALANEVDDKSFQKSLSREQEQARFNAYIHEISDYCWDKCLQGSPSSRVDRKTEGCISNCVDRFIDVSVMISQRFVKLMELQKGQ